MGHVKDLMENKLHNYVYLYKSNYMHTSKESPVTVFRTIKNNILTRVQSKKNQVDLNKLAAIYDSKRSLLLGLNEKGSSNDKRIQEAILNVLNEELGVDIEEVFDINWDKLSVAVKNNSKEIVSRVKRIRSKTREDGKKSLVNYQTILNRINELKGKINAALQKDDELNDITIEKLKNGQKQLNELVEVLNRFFETGQNSYEPKDLKNALKKAGFNIPKSGWKIENPVLSGKRMDIQTARAIRNLINGIVAGCMQGFKQQILGNLFEMFLYATLAMSDDIAETALEDTFKKALKEGGQNFITGTFNISGSKDILNQVLDEVSNTSVDLGNGQIKAEIKYSSQQKADLIVSIDQKPIGISAKNYSSRSFKNQQKMLTLQSGSSLFIHLLGANEFHPKAMRHFLNILAEQPEGKSKASNFKPLKELGLDTLGLLILFQSATGKALGKQTGFADVLAFNDNHTGETRFYDINTIIEYFYNKNKNNFITPKLDSFSLPNKKVYIKDNLPAAINKRIATVLQASHAQKIKASIPINELKNIT